MAWVDQTFLEQKRPVFKEDLWVVCESCKSHVYRTDWEKNISVCPKCNFHGKLTPQQRIDLVCDPGSFTELNENISPCDPLGFSDEKETYKDKIAIARKKLKQNESVITGTGAVHGINIVLAIMDFRFFGGSLGSATGEKILLAANHAFDNYLPYIIFSASSGARMQEGMLSLMQMAKTCAGIARLADRKIPYLSVLTHPTTGGVSASFAMVGNINIAEPGALIGFAGKRVIEQTIKQELPDDFQTAEFVLKHGFIDMIIERRDFKKKIYDILSYHNAAPQLSSTE
jgi:acetyl-CoA carboxylase carboxyl transferase subunit beta